MSVFSGLVKWDIYKALRNLRRYEGAIKDVSWIIWDAKKECAAITVDGIWEDEDVKALNNSSEIKSIVKKALKKTYQYSGEFYFDSDTPF